MFCVLLVWCGPLGFPSQLWHSFLVPVSLPQPQSSLYLSLKQPLRESWLYVAFLWTHWGWHSLWIAPVRGQAAWFHLCLEACSLRMPPPRYKRVHLGKGCLPFWLLVNLYTYSQGLICKALDKDIDMLRFFGGVRTAKIRKHTWKCLILCPIVLKYSTVCSKISEITEIITFIFYLYHNSYAFNYLKPLSLFFFSGSSSFWVVSG